MNVTRQDLQILRLPLLISIIVLALSITGIVYTQRLLKQSGISLENQQRVFLQAQSRLRKSGEERDIIIRHLPAYKALEAQGFIGAEQRINWLDAIRLTSQELNLFGAEYQISAQQPYPPSPDLDAGAFQMHQSAMRLSFKLLHEGNLLHFLNHLAQLRAGFYTLESCELLRLVNNSITLHFQPALQATCQLSWVTITPVAAPGGNP